VLLVFAMTAASAICFSSVLLKFGTRQNHSLWHAHLARPSRDARTALVLLILLEGDVCAVIILI